MESYFRGIVSSLQDAADNASPMARDSVASRVQSDPELMWMAATQEEDEPFVTVNNASLGAHVKLANHYVDFVLASPNHLHANHVHEHGQIQSLDPRNFMCTVKFSGPTVKHFSLGPERSTLVFVFPGAATNKPIGSPSKTGRDVSTRFAPESPIPSPADYIGFRTRMSPADAANRSANSAPSPLSQSGGIDTLVGMGFRRDIAAQALEMSGGDITSGVEFAVSIAAPRQDADVPAVRSEKQGDSAAEFWSSNSTRLGDVRSPVSDSRPRIQRTPDSSADRMSFESASSSSKLLVPTTPDARRWQAPGQVHPQAQLVQSPSSAGDFHFGRGAQGSHRGLGMRVVEKEDGVYISQMAHGGVAASAEPFLQIGDRLLSIDGEPVRTEEDVRRLAAGKDGTGLILHCSRRSARHSSRPNNQGGGRVVSLVTLIRGVPGAHTVHTKRVRNDEALASAHPSLAKWVPTMLDHPKPPAPPSLLSPTSPASPATPSASPLAMRQEWGSAAGSGRSPAVQRRGPGSSSAGGRGGERRLKLGQTVAVQAGPLRGKEGRLAAVRGEEAIVHLGVGLRAFHTLQLAPASRTSGRPPPYSGLRGTPGSVSSSTGPQISQGGSARSNLDGAPSSGLGSGSPAAAANRLGPTPEGTGSGDWDPQARIQIPIHRPDKPAAPSPTGPPLPSPSVSMQHAGALAPQAAMWGDSAGIQTVTARGQEASVLGRGGAAPTLVMPRLGDQGRGSEVARVGSVAGGERQSSQPTTLANEHFEHDTAAASEPHAGARAGVLAAILGEGGEEGDEVWSIPSMSPPDPGPAEPVAPLPSDMLDGTGEKGAMDTGGGASGGNAEGLKEEEEEMTEEERERLRAWEREVEEEIGPEGVEALASLSLSPSSRVSLFHFSVDSPSLPSPTARDPSHRPTSSQKPYERRSVTCDRGPRGEELTWGEEGRGESMLAQISHVRGEDEGTGRGGPRRVDVGAGPKMEQDIAFEELVLVPPAIASGTYKTVFKALWKRNEVAALQVRQRWAGLEMEVEILRHFGKLRHPYLPAFHGISQDAEQRWYLVSEYFPLGGLDVQLEIWEGRLKLPVKLCVGQQICEAMIVIHQHGILHRDLATRNVLVYALDPESVADVWVKVTDFGLAREGPEYVNHSTEEDIPWRWTPPEVMRSKTWSARSDVWSFGVTMWEIFSDALIPYFEVHDDDELKQRVQANQLRLAQPAGCPDGVFAIMSWCWNHIPEQRPSFEVLAKELQQASSHSFQVAAEDDLRMASILTGGGHAAVKPQAKAETGMLYTM